MDKVNHIGFGLILLACGFGIGSGCMAININQASYLDINIVMPLFFIVFSIGTIIVWNRKIKIHNLQVVSLMLNNSMLLTANYAEKIGNAFKNVAKKLQ